MRGINDYYKFIRQTQKRKLVGIQKFGFLTGPSSIGGSRIVLQDNNLTAAAATADGSAGRAFATLRPVPGKITE